MSRSFSPAAFREQVSGFGARLGRDPKLGVRIGLGVLLALNLVAAYFVWRPLGGSPEELQQQAQSLEGQIAQHRSKMNHLQVLKTKASKARDEGDRFLTSYFMDRRTASSNIIFELNRMAKESGIRPKDHTFSYEPIEGTDAMMMMAINGNYEGTYADLMHYLNRLDRSQRFIIVDQLSASPQQGNTSLAVQMKLYTFVKEGGTPEEAEEALKKASMEPSSNAAPAATPVPTRPAPQVAPINIPPQAPIRQPVINPTPVPVNPGFPPVGVPMPPQTPGGQAGMPNWQGPADQNPNDPNYRPLRPGGPRRRPTRSTEEQ